MLRILKRPKHDVDDDEKHQVIEYIYVDSETLLAPQKYYQRISKNADIDTLKEFVAKKHNVAWHELFVCVVREGKIHRYSYCELGRYSYGELVQSIEPDHDLYIYHCVGVGSAFVVYHKYGDRRWSHDVHNYQSMTPHPLLVRLPWYAHMNEIRSLLMQMVVRPLWREPINRADKLPFRIFAQRSSLSIEIVNSDEVFETGMRGWLDDGQLSHKLYFNIHWDNVHQFKGLSHNQIAAFQIPEPSAASQMSDAKKDDPETVINYTYVDADVPQAPKKYHMSISENANIDALKKFLARKHGEHNIELVVCEVHKNRIHRELSGSEAVADINQQFDIFIYRFALCGVVKDSYVGAVRFPSSWPCDYKMYAWKRLRRFAVRHMRGERKGSYTNMGYPLLLPLPLPDNMAVTMRDLHAVLCTTVRHFLKDKSLKETDELPYRLWAQWGHHNSLEIVDSDTKFAMNKRNLNFSVHWSDVEQFETVSEHNNVAEPAVHIQLPTYTRESLQALDKEEIIDAMLRLQMAVSARNGRRMVECPHCFISVADEDLSDHTEICLEAPKPCTLCGTLVVRKNETDHWRTECTAYECDCFECGITLRRGQLSDHYTMHYRHGEFFSRPEITIRVSDPKPARWPRALNPKPKPVALMPAAELVPLIVPTETAPLPTAPLPGVIGSLLPGPDLSCVSNVGFVQLKSKVKELAQHNPNLLRALQETPRKLYAVLRDPYIKQRLADMMGLVYLGYEPRVNTFEDLRRIDNETVCLVYGFCRESALEAGLRLFSE